MRGLYEFFSYLRDEVSLNSYLRMELFWIAMNWNRLEMFLAYFLD